jgi:hypothetical protein
MTQWRHQHSDDARASAWTHHIKSLWISDAIILLELRINYYIKYEAYSGPHAFSVQIQQTIFKVYISYQMYTRVHQHQIPITTEPLHSNAIMTKIILWELNQLQLTRYNQR